MTKTINVYDSTICVHLVGEKVDAIMITIFLMSNNELLTHRNMENSKKVVEQGHLKTLNLFDGLSYSLKSSELLWLGMSNSVRYKISCMIMLTL